MGWFGNSHNRLTPQVAAAAATELRASIDLFVYVRALRPDDVDGLIGGSAVGRLAAVALSRCLVEHGWQRAAPGSIPLPAQIRATLMETWTMFTPATQSAMARCYTDIVQRRLDAPSRLIFAQLEHWSEAAVGRHFDEGKPIRSGWLTYALGCATGNARLAASALTDFAMVAAPPVAPPDVSAY